ncbi:MAG: response regulator [Tepidisphaeraceae bacterium]
MSAASAGTVLVVDDHEVNRYTTGRILRGQGYHILEAGTGREAIELAEKYRPDLVMLDVNLPDLDGFEVCKQLRANPQLTQMAVIHISATFVTDTDHVHGLDSGADGYLTRPVDPIVLAATARACIRARRAEAEVLRREHELLALAENTPDILSRFDTQLRHTYVNSAAERATGLPRDQFIGKTNRELGMPVELCEQIETGLRRTMESKQPQSIHFSMPVGDVVREFVSRLIPEFSSGHRVEHVLGITHDVTERKQIERDRERLLEAERAARAEADRLMRVKDEFIATLSHELRTPLNAILGWTQILQRGTPEPAACQQAIEVISRNARLQAEMISDLLDMNRIMSGKLRLTLTHVDLNDVTRSAVEALAPMASTKRLNVSLKAPADPSWVMGDAGRLQQVVWNILSNAAKFTPDGGSIDLTVDRTGDHVQLRVRDTGAGIDPKFLPQLFDRFSQADASAARKHGGLGIGLSIVKQIVDLLEGTIEARSEGSGKGSTFIVTLPAINTPTAAIESSEQESPDVDESEHDIDLNGLSVLLVDDQADSREFVVRLLTEAGADVWPTASGHEAITRLSARAPDVLLSDLGMPGMTGYDLLQHIRGPLGISPDRLPAIAVSAFSRDTDRQRAAAAGFQEHLSKPVQPHTLVAAIHRWGHRAGVA